MIENKEVCTTDDVNKVTRLRKIRVDVRKSQPVQRVTKKREKKKSNEVYSNDNLVALACLSIISAKIFHTIKKV